MYSQSAQRSGSSSTGYFSYSNSDDTNDGERDEHDFYDPPASAVKAEFAASLGQVPRKDICKTWELNSFKRANYSENAKELRSQKGELHPKSAARKARMKEVPKVKGKIPVVHVTKSAEKMKDVSGGNDVHSMDELLELYGDELEKQKQQEDELEKQHAEDKLEQKDEDALKSVIENLSPGELGNPFMDEIPRPETFQFRDFENLLSSALENYPLKSRKYVSVFDCVLMLMSGVHVDKKKKYKRYGHRKIWISPDYQYMQWNSKKDCADDGWIRLNAVDQLVCRDNHCEVVTNNGEYRMTLKFPSPREEYLWKLAFINLIPADAEIEMGEVHCGKYHPYILEDDTFTGFRVRDYVQVNSYYILASAKGCGIDGRLGFCAEEQKFVAVRYIRRDLVPILLRSHVNVAVLKRLTHPNIVSQLEFLFDRESSGIYVIYEYVPEDENGINLKTLQRKPIKENDARPLIWDLIRALEYLHGMGISHGDIHPASINISVEGILKLNPLGAIRDEYEHLNVWQLDSITKARLGDCGSFLLPPERAWLCADRPNHVANDTSVGDVWAIGALLFVFVFGRGPFQYKRSWNGKLEAVDDMIERGVQKRIVNGEFDVPHYPQTSKYLKKLLKSILHPKHPSERITLPKLRTAGWFKQDNRIATPPEQHPSDYNLQVSKEQVAAAVQIAHVKKKKGDNEGIESTRRNSNTVEDLNIHGPSKHDMTTPEITMAERNGEIPTYEKQMLEHRMSMKK